MIRFIVSSLCVSGLIFGTFSGYRKVTHGFRFHKIVTKLAPNKNWDVGPNSDTKTAQINKILSQDFLFLDRGTQFYVFQSADRRYVLKFFRFDRMVPTFWVEKFPRLFPQSAQIQKKNFKTRLNHTMRACTAAYEKFRHKTALVFIHLNQNKSINKKVRLVDPLGREKIINLDEASFVLQKKLEPLKSVMKRAKKTRDIELQKLVISSFFDMLTQRSKEGICNTDPNVFKNFGFLDNQVMEIDFGDYHLDQKLKNPIIFEFEMDKYANVFRNWISKHLPDQVSYFDVVRQQTLDNYREQF